MGRLSCASRGCYHDGHIPVNYFSWSTIQKPSFQQADKAWAVVPEEQISHPGVRRYGRVHGLPCCGQIQGNASCAACLVQGKALTAMPAGVIRHFFFNAHGFCQCANQEQDITREEGMIWSHSDPELSKVVWGKKHHSASNLSITGCTVMYDCTVVLCTTGVDGNFFI